MRRRLAHRDRARAERLDGEAEARELVGARQQPLDVGLVELDDLGDQQDLPRDAAALERRLHALVDEPLMRGVLVDDDQAVARLRHDVGLVHLRARGAERPVEQVGRGLDDCRRAQSADGAPTSKAACAASAKPARSATRQRAAVGSGRAGERRQSKPARRQAAGRNAAMVALPPVVAARWPSRASASCSALHQQRAHQAGVAEAHLGLGRMHVDVDLARRRA